jgi:beta-galactosidase
MLARGISVNLYMAHGGTSWGFMSGANFAKVYQPDISSYDYDAPIDEAGRPTPKFTALQAAIRKHVPEAQPGPLPEPLPVIEIPRFELPESASLWQLLGPSQKAPAPRTMEALNQSYGFLLYRTAVEQAVQGKLEIEEVRDYVLAFQQGRRLGVLDRRKDEHALEVQLAAGAPLDLLVENMGRINFGPRLVNDWKGIGGRVTLGGAALGGWEHYPLPLDNLSKLKFSRTATPGPAFYRGEFTLARAGDTFLDLRGWGKGNVWVNGRNLGRYWRAGPQQSLFAPGCWLKAGKNTVIVLDLEDGGERTISGWRDPVWETPGA